MKKTSSKANMHHDLYRTWSSMRDRCLCKTKNSYHRYGGRGIKICDRWLESFNNFIDDMGNRPSRLHTLERIDNDGDYSKDNCRWATRYEQSINRQVPSRNSNLPRGVCVSSRGKWQSQIKIGGVNYYLGIYDDPKAAQLAFSKIFFEWYGRMP